MDKENKKSESALREEEVLQFWKENKIFEKSLEKDAPKGEYVFYEGPPTANGKPGIHHLEARAFKDVIPRYKTMCGYHVRRKGGWDTHGLPVELEVEKKLGLNLKKKSKNMASLNSIKNAEKAFGPMLICGKNLPSVLVFGWIRKIRMSLITTVISNLFGM